MAQDFISYLQTGVLLSSSVLLSAAPGGCKLYKWHYYFIHLRYCNRAFSYQWQHWAHCWWIALTLVNEEEILHYLHVCIQTGHVCIHTVYLLNTGRYCTLVFIVYCFCAVSTQEINILFSFILTGHDAIAVLCKSNCSFRMSPPTKLQRHTQNVYGRIGPINFVQYIFRKWLFWLHVPMDVLSMHAPLSNFHGNERGPASNTVSSSLYTSIHGSGRKLGAE